MNAEFIIPPVLMNGAQRRDALDLLRSLPPACAPLGFFDPQHRAVAKRYLNRLDHPTAKPDGSHSKRCLPVRSQSAYGRR
jgi:hypothetical protein